jgi:hypothetical protein
MEPGVTPGSLGHVRRDPEGCGRWLTGAGVVDGAVVTVAIHDRTMTVFDVLYEPPPSDHLPGYPAEHVRVPVRGDGAVYAVPVGGDQRSWRHRYAHYTVCELLTLSTRPIPWENLFGPLCLEYPADPAHLRWHWKDGIDAYLRIVQRHLWFEEYWRRHGTWPVEDTPHGHRSDGRPHPILTPALRSA